MKQAFTSDKSDKIMNKQQRQNPGRQASGAVTWPRQGRTSPRPFIPVPPGRGARSPASPPRLPTDRGVQADPLPPHARPQVQRPGEKAAASRRQVGDLPSPNALHHQWSHSRRGLLFLGGGDTEWVPTIRFRTLKKF
uniref:Uncharacterized protein n=1 Tax=Mustela putorius furo TaxID=9669 RepID=M3Y4U1_MUSPF